MEKGFEIATVVVMTAAEAAVDLTEAVKIQTLTSKMQLLMAEAAEMQAGAN